MKLHENTTLMAVKSQGPEGPFDTVEMLDMNELYSHPYVLNLVKVTFGLQDKGFDLLVDTGSTWNWVNACALDESGNCPPFFLDMRKQTDLECTGETKYIKYGLGSV